MTREEHRPLKYAVYKGISGKQGCFQFSLSEAYREGAKREEGAIFIEAAPAIGNNVYDWKQKIIFALSVNDIGTLLEGFRMGGCKIYHDPDANTERKGTRGKRLELEAGSQAGTMFLRLSEGFGKEGGKKISISLQPNETRILVALFTAAIPKILAWS